MYIHKLMFIIYFYSNTFIRLLAHLVLKNIKKMYTYPINYCNPERRQRLKADMAKYNLLKDVVDH